MSTYYLVNEADNTFTMRQTRYAEALKKGKEHKNDVCAIGFTKQDMAELVKKYDFDLDELSVNMLI